MVSGGAGGQARVASQRERYIFRDGTGAGGIHPPNNWVSVFGGPAWTRVVEPDGNPGQWYLHLFDAEQPDLNWDNPEVFDDLEKTLRFWLDRGVDGFRIDVAHGMAKPPGLPDMEVTNGRCSRSTTTTRGSTTTACTTSTAASAPCSTTTRTRSRSARSGCSTTRTSPSICVPTSCTSASTSGWCAPDFDAADIRGAIENSLGRGGDSRAPRRPGRCPITTSNVRSPATADGTVGLARARAMALVMLALPGAVFVYNGEELGLPNVELPDEALQDPVWERSGHTRTRPRRLPGADAVGRRRTAVRVLRQSRHLAADPAGVGDADGRDAAPANPDSTLSFFRRAIELRHNRPNSAVHAVEWLDAPIDVLVFRVSHGLVCVLNAGRRAMALPGGEVLLGERRVGRTASCRRTPPPGWSSCSGGDRKMYSSSGVSPCRHGRSR